MTRAIDDALALVLQDLQATGAPLPRIDWAATWQSWDPSESLTLFAAEGSGMGVWLDLGLEHGAALAHLADQVQEWVVEELGRRRLPTNWPVCADHPATHPRQAVVRDGRARWVCPAGGDDSTPVGELGRSRAS